MPPNGLIISPRRSTQATTDFLDGLIGWLTGKITLHRECYSITGRLPVDDVNVSSALQLLHWLEDILQFQGLGWGQGAEGKLVCEGHPKALTATDGTAPDAGCRAGHSPRVLAGKASLQVP